MKGISKGVIFILADNFLIFSKLYIIQLMEEEEDLVVCQNCEQKFPSFKIDLHEAYCRRNIKRCKLCSKMVDVNQQEVHHEQFHAEKSCQFCKKTFLLSQIQGHAPNCQERPVECKHCQNPFPFSTIERHEEGCGSRTKRCERCKKYVKLRQFDQHTQTCQFVQPPRNESSSAIRELPRYDPYNNNRNHREMMNSNEKIKKEQTKEHWELQIPRGRKEAEVIGREPISQLVDPVPISIRIAMQRQKQKRGLK